MILLKPIKRFVSSPAMLLFAFGLVLAGCADTEEVYVEQPVEHLYNKALNQLENKDYELAAESFDEVDRQHPYSVWATKSQLMAAYSFYQDNKYDDAIFAADHFINLHPSNRDVAYAYYIKAISYYEQISDVGRDQRMTELAMKTLREIVTRFPNSRYARDAALKIDLTHDHLAGKEMEIGRYYENQRQYLAAINRFKNVIKRFQTTTHVPEALHRLTESYLALGLKDQARRTAAVLGHNFPGSEWYIDSFEIVEGKDFLTPDEIEAKKKAGKAKPWYWPF